MQFVGGTVYPSSGQFIPGIKCPRDSLSRNTGNTQSKRLYNMHRSQKYFEIKRNDFICPFFDFDLIADRNDFCLKG